MFTHVSYKQKLYYIAITVIYSIIITIIYLIFVSSSPKVNVVLVSHSSHIDFKQQLFNERLTSYNLRYNNFLPVCNKTNTLNDSEKHAYQTMSQLLQTFQKEIKPYPNDYFNGRGIVLTLGRSQLNFAKANLKMMELTKTKLSVQIWYSSNQIPRDQIIDLLRTVPNLNASVCCFITNECRTLTKVWQLNRNHVHEPRVGTLRKQFPYKPAAILSSTFSEVLFLDCDAYVTRDPEELFLSDPMYLKFGALFFPDAFKSRQNSAVWNLFNTSCADDEYEFDSATILVDKRKVWDGLYMATLMNDDHELFYKYVTDGDKDTFRLAFRYMQVKYYLVMTPCATGSYNGSHFCGYSLCKTDSLSQHIYINHIHIFKYHAINYSPVTLGYTRIGLGDPNNNSFYFHHCHLKKAPTSCFHILKEPKEQTKDFCYMGDIPLEEIEDHEYQSHESLTTEKSKQNRVLLGKTDNLSPHFVENFLRLEIRLGYHFIGPRFKKIPYNPIINSDVHLKLGKLDRYIRHGNNVRYRS